MTKKRVLFIQHSDVDRPGLLGETLDGIGLPLEVIRPDLGQSVPESLDAFAGLVIGGGPQGAYEQEKYPLSGKRMRSRAPCSVHRKARARVMPGSANYGSGPWGSGSARPARGGIL